MGKRTWPLGIGKERAQRFADFRAGPGSTLKTNSALACLPLGLLFLWQDGKYLPRPRDEERVATISTQPRVFVPTEFKNRLDALASKSGLSWTEFALLIIDSFLDEMEHPNWRINNRIVVALLRRPEWEVLIRLPPENRIAFAYACVTQQLDEVKGFARRTLGAEICPEFVGHPVLENLEPKAARAVVSATSPDEIGVGFCKACDELVQVLGQSNLHPYSFGHSRWCPNYNGYVAATAF